MSNAKGNKSYQPQRITASGFNSTNMMAQK
jgi:hypothetical protein